MSTQVHELPPSQWLKVANSPSAPASCAAVSLRPAGRIDRLIDQLSCVGRDVTFKQMLVLPESLAQRSARCPPPSPGWVSSAALGPSEPLKGGYEKQRQMAAVRAERKSCWKPVLSQRIESNTISFQLRSQGKKGDLQVPGITALCKIYPPRKERELNWLDSHYWRRIGEQRVESQAPRRPTRLPLVPLKQKGSGWSGTRRLPHFQIVRGSLLFRSRSAEINESFNYY